MPDWLGPLLCICVSGLIYMGWMFFRMYQKYLYLHEKNEALNSRVDCWEEHLRASIGSLDSKVSNVKSNIENVKKKIFK